MDPAMREALLRNVVSLLERAPLTPGGQNIRIATDNLNQYFKNTPDEAFLLSPESKSYLTGQMAESPFKVEDFEARAFALKDARHIEDCLLYHNIAARVAGPGTILERVRRLFDWTIRHVQLVPPESPIPEILINQGIRPAPTRPYDVIVRGFASEIPGDAWAERSWVFLALCRQIGVDAAMIGYTVEEEVEVEGEGEAEIEVRERPYYWACAALADGVPYLFDTRLGMEIPGPGGEGVATIEQAAADPTVLDHLDLPDPPIPYPTGSADLARVRVFLDSSRGYFAPKMGLLQNDLAGANRMVLYRDPAEQRDAWASALGDRLEAVELWELPLVVEFRLFTDPTYVQAIQFVNFYFDPQFPMLGARLRQLRGDLADAKQEFTRARFRRNVPQAPEGQDPRLFREIQESIDLMATYYLALAQLDDAMPEQAINLFEQALRLPPQQPPIVRGRPATLLRLGAEANLGMLYDSQGDAGRASYHYSRDNSTPQSHGNLLRANALVFEDPFGPPPPPAGSDADEAPGEAPAPEPGPEPAEAP
jgi:tetratricopeptide (TPR) repeat protein